jgi:hypothetical protein
MKELSGTSHNLFFTDEHKPMAEIILVISEPEWRIGVDDLVRERKSENVRIVFGIQNIKSLIKVLSVIEKDLDQMLPKLENQKETMEKKK